KAADIDFTNGFMVLSGETGAGKSIVIDSINLLSGSRLSRDMIRTGEDRLLVSAVFTDCRAEAAELLESYGVACDGSVMITRTLSRDGKSTVKINGRTVTQSLQRELCRLLINIHGQNENQRLMQKSAQIDILDSYAENGELRAAYAKVYRSLIETKDKIAELESDTAEKLRTRDMLRYQIEEIAAARLKVGEEEALEAESARLSSMEKIHAQTHLAYRALYGSEKSATVLLERAASALEKIGDVLPEAAEGAKRLTEFRYEIEDIADTVQRYAESDEDPTLRLNKIEARLSTIAKLRRKYGADVSEILAFRERAQAQLDTIENADAIREELERECRVLEAEARELAAQIRDRRYRAAETVQKEVSETLAFLDMPKVRFCISLTESEKLRADGGDVVEFLISANAGEEPGPLERIASGGELSRIMLALKSVLSDKDGVATVIFDEVDAGISGKTSRKVGLKLREIARQVQVICVTHSAQIASLADRHFLISKNDQTGRAETEIAELDSEGRVDEVARILGGIHVTETQRAVAREMIEEGNGS
ncbi:MAG: DNA repair protein RecN, partial [Clostridia bacterium]|nr:DNA repair protein RecN [Clostridia bacterium]